MANPVVSVADAIDGEWLVPYTASGSPVAGQEAWIGGPSAELSADVSMDEYTIFTRQEILSQDGVLHLYVGTIAGLIISHNGQTAATWMTRLENLVKNQRSFGSIRYVTARYDFRVKLKGLSKSPVIAGGRAWSVSVPFREVS